MRFMRDHLILLTKATLMLRECVLSNVVSIMNSLVQTSSVLYQPIFMDLMIATHLSQVTLSRPLSVELQSSKTENL